MPLPEILDKPAFREAWEARCRERSEPGVKGRPSATSTASTLASLARFAVEHGLPATIAAVRAATDGRWQGIRLDVPAWASPQKQTWNAGTTTAGLSTAQARLFGPAKGDAS